MDNSLEYNKFSWHRCLSLWRVNGRSIRKQLMLYVGLTLGIYLIDVLILTLSTGWGAVKFYSFLGIVTSYMLYLSPLVFFGRDKTLMAQLPVSPGEKTVFYVVYCVVFMTIVVQGLWYLCCWLGGYIFTIGNINSIVEMKVYSMVGNIEVTPEMRCFTYFANYVQVFFISVCVLYIVFHERSYVILKSVLTPVVYLMAIGVFGGIIGIVDGFNDAVHGIDADPDTLTSTMFSRMQPYIILVTAFSAIFGVFAITRIYRNFKHPRIAR